MEVDEQSEQHKHAEDEVHDRRDRRRDRDVEAWEIDPGDEAAVLYEARTGAGERRRDVGECKYGRSDPERVRDVDVLAGAEAGEAPEDRGEDHDRHERPQDRPARTEVGLPIARLHVPEDEEPQEVAVAPKLPGVYGDEPWGGFDPPNDPCVSNSLRQRGGLGFRGLHGGKDSLGSCRPRSRRSACSVPRKSPAEPALTQVEQAEPLAGDVLSLQRDPDKSNDPIEPALASSQFAPEVLRHLPEFTVETFAVRRLRLVVQVADGEWSIEGDRLESA